MYLGLTDYNYILEYTIERKTALTGIWVARTVLGLFFVLDWHQERRLSSFLSLSLSLALCLSVSVCKKSIHACLLPS